MAALVDWPSMWAPYDQTTYDEALSYLHPGERVLDIGAGDLRFARQVVQKLHCHVVAVEKRIEAIQQGVACGTLSGIEVVAADARYLAFPIVDTAVLLMRHCEDFLLYVHKLRRAGCQRLITNARWRMGVECVPLEPAAPYRADYAGWYACVRCGCVRFNPGDPSRLPADADIRYLNVECCPACELSASDTLACQNGIAT